MDINQRCENCNMIYEPKELSPGKLISAPVEYKGRLYVCYESGVYEFKQGVGAKYHLEKLVLKQCEKEPTWESLQTKVRNSDEIYNDLVKSDLNKAKTIRAQENLLVERAEIIREHESMFMKMDEIIEKYKKMVKEN